MSVRIFAKHNTALDVVQGIDLSGKTYLVTGANSGIGYETAKALAFQGGHVVIACRDMPAAERTRDRIREEKNDAKINMLRLDCSDMRTVQQCADAFQRGGWPLNCLILNAGVYNPAQQITDDGFETTFQVNYLAQFYLTKLLLPQLMKSEPARVVVVSSLMYRLSFLDASDIKWDILSPTQMVKMPAAVKTYSNSKLCGILFANELTERYEKDGIRANSLHPGVIQTRLARNSGCMQCMNTCAKPISSSVAQGAATTAFVATAPELDDKGGVFFEYCMPASRNNRSRNPESGRRLWELSEEMVTHFENTSKTSGNSNDTQNSHIKSQ